MADGWRSSEGAESHVASKSPWSSDRDEKKEEVQRVGWGDNIAPLAQNMPQVNNTLDGPNPNENGGNGKKPWRAGFGGQGGVAPGASAFPPAETQQTQGNSPWRAKLPDSTYRGPQGTDAASPDAAPGTWRAGYPDSSYKGPGSTPAPSPWNQNPGRATYPETSWKPENPNPPSSPSPWNPNPGRATYPDSTYKGPPTEQQIPQGPQGQGALDWRAYAEEQQRLAQQQRQPGAQPGGLVLPGLPGQGSGADRPGVPGNPGLNPVTEDQRKWIENSLTVKTSVTGYLGTGAITGGVVGAAEWALDKKLLATAGEPQTGLMGWWQTHSPILKEQRSYAERLAGAEGVHSTRVAEQAIAKEALTDGAQKLKGLVSSIDDLVAKDPVLAEIRAAQANAPKLTNILDATQINAVKAEREALAARVAALEPAQQLLLKQQSFISAAANITNSDSIAKVVGTQAELEAGKKLFVTGTQEATLLQDFARLSKANSQATTAIKTAEAELERSRAMLQESVDGGAGSLAGRSFNGAVKGLAISAGSLAIGYGIDKGLSHVFGYKAPETDGMGRFALDGIAVPAILMSNLPSRYKFALAGTAFMSARVADYWQGTGAGVQMSTLLRPNLVDGVGITAAAMAPLDPKWKAAAIGGAWLLGRAYNGIARATGLDGGQPMELKLNQENAFTHDQLTRSTSSFDNAVEKAKILGKENEAALELQVRDWMSKQNSTAPISHMRGTAALTAGLGQFRLEEGSRFDLASHADKKARILKGYNYDFGGEATTWLRMSAGSLASAQNFVIQNKGKEIDGQKMDDAYMEQLKSAQKKVEQQLDKVYGPHDIKGIFNELKNQARVNSGDMQQALVRMKNQFDVLNTKDTKYIAKSARDLAIGYLAESSYMASKGNGEEARTMYLAAVQYVQASQRLDPSAPDNKALDDLAKEVVLGVPAGQQSIPKAIDSQYKSNWNNPFQMPTPQYPDMQLRK